MRYLALTFWLESPTAVLRPFRRLLRTCTLGQVTGRDFLTLLHCTVADNFATGLGDGLFVVREEAMVDHTLIALNGGGGDCAIDPAASSASILSLGHNLDSDGSCPWNGAGDLPSVDPLLGPLSDNGGATLTHALLPGSPAIDAGDPAGCTDANGLPLTEDQRGFPRPTDGDGDRHATCDIGAFEAAGGVPVCHAPPGNLGRVRTLLVEAESMDAHLSHGDHSGACDEKR